MEVFSKVCLNKGYLCELLKVMILNLVEEYVFIIAQSISKSILRNSFLLGP